MTQLRLRGTLAKLKKVRVKISLGKRQQVAIPSSPQRPVPRGFKIIEKYPLYEPFAHVAIVQSPRTGNTSTFWMNYSLTRLREAFTAGFWTYCSLK